VATPTETLVAQTVMGIVGNFGDAYTDVTRPGAVTHRFRYEGKRGRQTQVEAVQFYVDKAAAITGRNGWEAMQGSEVYLKDTLNDHTWQVFVHAVDADVPRRVEVVGGGLNDRKWMLRARLSITRTV